MSLQVTGDFYDTFRRDLDDVFSLNWDKEKFEFEDAMDVDSTDQPFLEDYMYDMPHEIFEVEEGGAYPRVNIRPSGSKRQSAFTLRSEIAFSEEDLEDVKIKQFKDGAEALATALHYTVEMLSARVLIDAFTSKQGMDNVSIFNTAHPLSRAAEVDPENPTTYSNRSQLSPTVENIQDRYVHAMQQCNNNGDMILTKPKKIIFGPHNSFRIPQLLQNEWETGTADRNKSMVKGLLDPVMLSFIARTAYPRAWILADPRLMKLRFRWRAKPASRIKDEEKTDNKLYRIRTRIILGWSDWRGVDGNTGEV